MRGLMRHDSPQHCYRPQLFPWLLRSRLVAAHRTCCTPFWKTRLKSARSRASIREWRGRVSTPSSIRLVARRIRNESVIGQRHGDAEHQGMG